ncbi:cysteine proteinase [Exidia glandulosa HHB12029]|uniref:Ubiquitin carboxyl-terminal hydrolase n=1 Tax=Exidia glandulosa HHB12029 TaxID=1314781 RepID=A0A166NG64_EXIGL|nr:cysteine proteinase [Exidia glandulosa HHB12029]
MSRPSPYGYYNPNQPPPPRHLWQQHPPYPGPPPPFPPQHGAHFNPYAQPFPGPPPAAHAHPRPPYGPPPALFQPPALPPHMQPPHQLHHLPHQQLPAPHAIHPHQPPPLHLNPHPHDHDQQQQQQPQPLSPAEDDLSVVPGWVISRWRYDVASAPAVAFSPLSNPPQRIFDDALEYPPAPKPPKQKPRPARRPSLPLAHHPQPEHNDSPSPSPAPAALPSPPKTPPPAPKRELVVESVSVAETTPATSVAPESPTPHSPLSTNTSLSVSPKISQDATPSAPAPLEQPKEEPAPSTSAPAPAEPEPESQPQAVQADVTPTAPTPASPPAPTPAPEVAAPAPAPPPTKPVKPPVKSWADLMKSNTKGGLPTSSVVGVSIPADAPRSSLANASPAKRAATQAIVQLLSAPAPPVAASSTILPRGLINGGNLCFANAILQALVYCPPFHRLFAELGRLSASAAFQTTTQQNKLRGTVGARLGATPTPLVDATINFLDEFAPRSTPAATPSDPSRSRSPTGSAAGADSDAFIPTYIYDALKQKKRFDSMRRGHQEDAEEFLGFYLDTLEEELLALLNELSPAASSSKPPPGPVKSEVVEETASDEAEDGWTEVGKRNRAVVVTNIKTTESPISRVFGGKFRSILRQPGTGRDSVTLQDWNRLQLDIQPPHVLSITDALRNLVAAEPVQVDGKDATKQVQLDTLPRVLVLHLKRFAYDATLPGGGGVVKNGKRIAFEPVLELGNELMVPARRASNPTHIPKYKLSAVVYHHGQSATGGHYTLDVLHPAAGQATVPWVRLDDDIVTRVRAEDVFGQDGADDKVAYLLFYRPIGNIR